jgi:L-threonylcarbamoyladenylate synthase
MTQAIDEERAIQSAAHALQRGELIGLPTETVYGLAADACNDAAVAKIFIAKGRPSDHPLIVHVTDRDAAQRFASEIPDFAQRLIAAFWPGPLTLILPRRDDVAAAAAGGQNSVGIRCPSHPIARQILHAAQSLGVWGVAAPSANKFGRVSPTTAAHVRQEFGDALLVVDGGACEVGIESAIVDCTRGRPVLLRPGVLTLDQLSTACGQSVLTPLESALACADAPKASGTLAAHYAPVAKLVLMDQPALVAALSDWLTTAHTTRNVASANACPSEMATSVSVPSACPLAIWSHQPLPALAHGQSGPSGQIHWRAMPTDPVQCAHELFAQLRDFDALGVQQIWVERPASTSAWEGVRDRLSRAEAADR